MPAGFLMDGNPVRTHLDESRDELVGILDHQVAVKRQVRRLPQGLHDRRANGQVWNEMPVHDVDVNHRTATFRGATDLVRQMGEISRQYRRCQFDQTWVSRRGILAEILTWGPSGTGLETAGARAALDLAECLGMDAGRGPPILGRLGRGGRPDALRHRSPAPPRGPSVKIPGHIEAARKGDVEQPGREGPVRVCERYPRCLRQRGFRTRRPWRLIAWPAESPLS